MTSWQYIKDFYAKLRAMTPDDPFGPQWEKHGYYCGDGVWCDPEYVNSRGEFEIYVKSYWETNSEEFVHD
jgi:hypothetical protein